MTWKTCGIIVMIAVAMLTEGCSKGEPFSMDLIPVRSDGKWGYVDAKGKIIINPQFREASPFSGGIARVIATDGKVGYIDQEGTYIVNPTYKYGTVFSEGLACVTKENGSPEYIDNKGRSQFSVSNAEMAGTFSEGLAPVQVSNKWGFVNTAGEMVINPQFDEVQAFSDGLVAARLGADWGYIDKAGQIAVAYQFQQAQPFKSGKARVSNGSQYGYITADGRYLINPQFDDAGNFSEDVASFRQGKAVGYIDEKGKIIINPQFSHADVFSGGLAAVASGSKWGYVDKEGKFIINPQFEWASRFFGGIAFVHSGGRVGIIDDNGRYLANPQFDAVNFTVELPEVVRSDFFDVQASVNYLLEGTGRAAFRNLSARTTLTDVIGTIYKEASRANLNQNVLRIPTEVTIDEQAAVRSIQLSFDAGPFSYASRSYTYRDAWGQVREVSAADQEIPTDSATVTAISMMIVLSGRGSGKASLVADAIETQLAGKVGGRVEPVPNGFTVNASEMKCAVTHNQSTLWIGITFPFTRKGL
jgi:hypothetical protein